MALEPEFWAALEAWAGERNIPLSHVVVEVDAERGERPLASALRVAALLRHEVNRPAMPNAQQ